MPSDPRAPDGSQSAARASRYIGWAASAIVGVAIAVLGVSIAHDWAFAPVLESRDVRLAARSVQLRAMEIRDVPPRGTPTGGVDSGGLTRVRLRAALDSLRGVATADASSRRLVGAVVTSLDALDRVATAQPAADAAPRVAAVGAVRAAIADVIAYETDRQERWLRRLALIDNGGTVLVLSSLVLLAALLVSLARRLTRQTEVVAAQYATLDAQRGDLQARNVALRAAQAELSEAVADTERARTHASVEARERETLAALFDAAVESAPIGFAFFDCDGRVLRANAFIARLSGVPLAALPGTHVASIVSPENVRAVEIAIGRVVAAGRPIVNQRLTAPAREDGARDLLVNFYPVNTASGGVAGVACVVLDVTDRVALEEQLRQAQKLEAVGRLAGGIAHDFNNLLTVARTYCDLLIEELAADDAKRADLMEIRAATERAAGLSRRLLAFGRKQVYAPRSLDLRAVIESLQSMFVRTLPESVTLQVHLARDLPPVVGDVGQLEQVVMNLVLNAVDAMPDGGTVTIATAPGGLAPAAEGGEVPHVRLTVQDTGVGMEAETRKRVFEPFFTTKGPGKGTGLGLSTVYGIIEQHHGTVRVDSELGRGTTFTILLPCAGPDAAETDEPSRAAQPARAPSASATVLVVDAELALVASLNRLLAGRGYQVIGAHDAADALERARGHPGAIDAVLVELSVPGADLAAFLDRLEELRPQSAVVAMSAYAGDAHRRVVSERRLPFVQKPFAVDDLIAVVDQAIADRMGWSGDANTPPGTR